jgi:inner membrane protein
MRFYTHIAFGFLAALFLWKFGIVSTGNVYIFFVFMILGSLLPDIDTPDSKMGRKFGIVSDFISKIFGHRGIIHTIWGGMFLCGLFWYFINRVYGAALFYGFMSHLIADGFTVMGINFTHPILKLHLSGFVETGSMLENVFFALTIVLIVVMII